MNWLIKLFQSKPPKEIRTNGLLWIDRDTAVTSNWEAIRTMVRPNNIIKLGSYIKI
jgi:hypothetical protein